MRTISEVPNRVSFADSLRSQTPMPGNSPVRRKTPFILPILNRKFQGAEGTYGYLKIGLGREFKEYTGKFVWIYTLQVGIELSIDSINKTIGDDRITGGRRMDAIE